MPAHTNLSALAPLVERLVEMNEPADRDRVLLDAPFRLGIAPAVALWRPAAARPGAQPEWHEIVARGPRDRLPDKGQVLAVLGGHISGELPNGRRVLVAGSGRTLCALALGGVLDSEEGTDLIEALLVASTAIEEASAAAGSTPGLIDRVASVLPTATPVRDPEEYERLCHDVRNHLASIRATQELLVRYADRLNEDERTHFRGVLEREVRRASGLLVQAVHPESPDFRELRELLGCLRPAEVISDVVAAESAACEEVGVTLELTAEAGACDVTCALDELALARLVRNLVVNARQALSRHATSDRRIRVHVAGEVSDSGVWMVVSVADNGPGIRESDLGRVWESGFTSGKPDGHGFGLSVVHELTASVGGTAVASNLTPNGACFALRLPPAPAAD